MKALIDGDILRYSCGFSVQRKGQPLGPLEWALGNCKTLIKKILKDTNSDEYQVYLTGKGNYRDKLATILPYKGNRDKLHKPTYYNELTDYLVNVHGAITIDGKEADDEMGIEQYGSVLWEGEKDRYDGTCIASIDKDMNMIPGWHYNWNKEVAYLVSPQDAILWFYCQLIMGDRVDNIQGIPRYGPKKAFYILEGCETEEEMYGAVLAAYEVAGIPEQLEENANLLWIQREDGVLWKPPV